MALTLSERPTHVVLLNSAAARTLYPKARILVLGDADFPPPLDGEYNVAVLRDHRSDLGPNAIQRTVVECLRHNFNSHGPIEGPDAAIALRESLQRVPIDKVERLRKTGHNVLARHQKHGCGVIIGRRTPCGFDVGDIATAAEIISCTSTAIRNSVLRRQEVGFDAAKRAKKRNHRRTYKDTFSLSTVSHHGTDYVKINGHRTMTHQHGMIPPATHIPLLVVASGDYAGLMLMGGLHDLTLLANMYPESFIGKVEEIQ